MTVARAVLVIPLIGVALAACGGGGGQRGAERCDDTAPGPDATFATADVAFAAPEGEEIQSDRAGGYLPWLAKFGLRRACGPETLTGREQFLVAKAQLVFARIALAAIDHAACVEEAGARACAASGDNEADQLLDVLRAKPDGIYELRDQEVAVRELVARAADDLRDSRPQLAAKLDAALEE